MTQKRPNRMPADHIGALISGVMMMVVGWGGLALLILTRPPRLGAELWLFFFLLLAAVTGTVLPIVRYINMRFTPLSAEPPPGGVLVRQSVWIGLFVVVSAWLQILRVLTVPNAFFLALVFIVLEVFLRSRERD
jgi:hypothetical protein